MHELPCRQDFVCDVMICWWRHRQHDSTGKGLLEACTGFLQMLLGSIPCALCDYTSCVCSLTSPTLPQPGRLSGQPLLPDQSVLCPNLCLRPAKNQVHTDTSATQGPGGAASTNYTSMDPVQKCNSTLTPESSPVISEETSREVTAASPPSFSELLMMGLGDLKTGAGTKHPAPLPEGLLQQRYRDEKTLQERRWERSASPQRKRTLLGHMRRRHLDHVAPYRVERKARISSLGDRDQNRFRCECRYCQSHRPSVSGMPAERKGAPHPSSWDTLVQGLSGLTLSLGTSRPGLLPDGVLQQQEREEKLQREMQQESKRMFQRLLKQWLKEN
ncbi:protein FAM156A/FAM156B isoform X2 [Lontra canadensis]|uniref:protein FAM156A/FAM156B isoform X2 n=2 Tax=Lontra canadensis TaxID=76717 RepID=UPI0013F3209D|nr:protein FAM156A/FAM156B isoform X2 [Lontra canadensis]